jgi:hypothetical protein
MGSTLASCLCHSVGAHGRLGHGREGDTQTAAAAPPLLQPASGRQGRLAEMESAACPLNLTLKEEQEEQI